MIFASSPRNRQGAVMRRLVLGTCLAGTLLIPGLGHAAAPSDSEIAGYAAKMTGIWQGPPPSEKHEVGERAGGEADLPPDADPPAYLLKLLQPWALKIHNKYLEFIAFQREQSLDVPTPDALCLPFAMPSDGSAAYGFPFQLLITPKAVVFLMELDGQMRIVRMNDQHPAHVTPSWYGDSVGHWDGDTLVIDTIGYNARSEIQEFPAGWPHTDKVHTIERYKLSGDGKHLDVEWTYEDPGALKAPFITHKALDKSEYFQEFINAENNLEFGCPTAEKGTAYVPLTMETAEAKLRDAKAVAAAKAATKASKP